MADETKDPMREALEDEVRAMEMFARAAESFAAGAAGSPAHWAGADARATAMREAAAMVRKVLAAHPAAPEGTRPPERAAEAHDGAWWLEDAARKAETWAEARDILGAHALANTLREFAAALRGQVASLREQVEAAPGVSAGGEALPKYPPCPRGIICCLGSHESHARGECDAGAETGTPGKGA